MNQGTHYAQRIKQELTAIRNSGKKLCVCPMGLAGMANGVKYCENGIPIDFFYDNNPKLWGTQYHGIVCLSKEELLQIKDEVVLIIEGMFYHEIRKQMMDEGFSCYDRIYSMTFAPKRLNLEDRCSYEDEIQKVLALCADERSREVFQCLTDAWGMESIPDDYFQKIMDPNQYFDTEIIHLRQDEVFVDLGAYIGDSWEQFLSACHGKYEKAHLFEMDPNVYRRLMKHVGDILDGPYGGEGIVQCYPYGVSNQTGDVQFTVGESGSTLHSYTESQSNQENICFGKCVRLDDILKNERVTFIKTDIEGAEQDALRGAAELIKKQKPKLAISIYHSPEDMLEIPVYLKTLVPEYQIYIRHYTDLMYETVCYAVVE